MKESGMRWECPGVRGALAGVSRSKEGYLSVLRGTRWNSQEVRRQKAMLQLWRVRCGLEKEVLMGFGYMVLKKLEGGMKEQDVKAWVCKAVVRDP